MNEIEKLYKNAGVKKRRHCEFDEDCPYGFSHSCDNCDIELRESNSSYPPFTAEKQLKLLKFLSKLDLYGEVILRDSFDEYLVKVEITDPGFTLVKAYRNTLEEAIAAVINKRWEHLSEKQKQEVKGILE